MLSVQTIQTLEKLHQTQNRYTPSPDVAALLQHKSLIMFVGPTSAGKNTIMQALADADIRFNIAGTFTSREPRTGDDPAVYTYIPNTDKNLHELFGRIARHELVQYAVNPHAQLIYGSTIEDYAGVFNLRDVFSSAIAGFEHLSFERTITVSIVSQPETWTRRFEERFPAGDPSRAPRLKEAIESLSWILDQTDSDRFIVENFEGDPDAAARSIINIANGTEPDQKQVRELGRANLEAVKRVRA